jgi:2-dehydropantoate 2-reductase
MRILIYGAGAVGLGLGSCLIKSGAMVDLIARKQTADKLRENGLGRTGIFGDHHASPESFNAFSSLKEIKNNKYDHILVCVKSYDSKDTARDLSGNAHIMSEESKIILCQNGWGNAEIFREGFPEKNIYNARIITGFSRPEGNKVQITVHADAIHIGNLWDHNSRSLEKLCRKIHQGGIPCQLVDDIGKDLWAKMLYNCALNPLGAVLGVSYGDLIRHDSSRKIMESIINEIFDVIKEAGFATHWKDAEKYLEVFYGHEVPSTAAHLSSTLQSLKAQKKTELDALNGAVIRLADKYDVPVPVNQTLYRMVKFLEEAAI